MPGRPKPRYRRGRRNWRGADRQSPLLSLSGSNANPAESQSRSDLVANGDGTFGLRSTVSEEIAPVSINLGPGVAIVITMAGAVPGGPVSLSTGTDGNGHNTTLLGDNDVLAVNLVAAGVATNLLTVNPGLITGPNGLVVNANTLPVVGSLLSALGVS